MDDGGIPGNAAGDSCGRMGGLVVIDQDALVQTYSRKAGCRENLLDELGAVFFNSKLEKSKTVILGEGNSINSLKTAKYGQNILIATAELDEGDIPSGTYNYDYLKDGREKMYMMLIDKEGAIIADKQQLAQFSLEANVDFEVFNNGRVVWPFIDPNNKVFLYMTPTPDKGNTGVYEDDGES